MQYEANRAFLNMIVDCVFEKIFIHDPFDLEYSLYDSFEFSGKY